MVILRSLFVLLLLLSGPLRAEVLSIAVAANFTDAMRELAPLFEKDTGHSLKVSYGSTGKLYAQIAHGAPFGVFLSADAERARRAEAEGLAVSGSRFTYAVGRLALWTPRAGVFDGDSGEAYLKAADFRRLAIANPKTAPYGQAAQQLLQRFGLWSAMRGRLVRGDSIAQTFQFTATGNVEAGLVAYSQARAWGEGSLWLVPQAYYQPIEQQAVLLKRGANNPAALAFIDFLKGDAARALITGYGYGL